MAKQTINIGSAANDGTGDTLRDAFDKCNDNFDELYFNLVTPFELVRGNSNVNIGSDNADVTISVNNTSNVAVFSTAGMNLTGRLIASGNVTAANVRTAKVDATDDITTTQDITATGSLSVGATVDAGGNISGENLNATGNVVSNAFIIGDGGFLSNVTAISNVAVSQLANGASILSINGSGGNITGTVGGSGVLTLTSTGANITGYNTVTGNVDAGNLITGGAVEATGNITGGNIISLGSFEANSLESTTSITAGTTITATGNVTGGNLNSDASIIAAGLIEAGTTITATGNISGGNIDGTTGTFTNIGGTLSTAAQPSVTSVGTLTSLTLGGNVQMSNNNINGLAEPVAGSDAATKTYVDTISSAGLHYHDPVRVESEVALSADYDNGTSGVGATLTNNSTQAALVIDGITLNTSDRVLVYQQSNAAHNGIYTVTNTGSVSTNWVLTRATDADSYGPSDPDSLGEGDAFFVQEGAAGAGELYVMNTSGTITFGTTNITFSQINSAQIYSATNGVDLTGVTFSLDATYSPTFAGITVPSITKNGTDGVGNIGQSDNAFNTVFAQATSAQYADLAERYTADAQYAPGTVVVFGGEKEVTQSNIDADPAVAGVVSTSPAYLMNDGLQSEFVVTVALVGRVPVAVTGPVKKGQMLVNCGGGLARAEDNPAMGTVIGKALQDTIPEAGPGLVSVIEVVVGRL